MDKAAWIEERRRLAAVAAGREPADLVITGARVVSVATGEVLEDHALVVAGERIAYLGPDAGHAVGEKTEVVDAGGMYLVPGLLDAHVHVESGMVTLTEFARAVLPRGTTGLFIDPHEIANVFGLEGVRLFLEEARTLPLHVWVQVPSCVPSAPGLETAGATITPEDVAEAMGWEGVIGLGEVMNFPGVIAGEEALLAEMAATAAAGKTIGGHYASPELGPPLAAYAAAGAEDDHEGTRLEDALARTRLGMRAMLRYGSGWLDVAAQVRAITEKGLDPRRFLLCTDDSHAGTLAREGHMDRVLRHAIAQGLSPVVAVQMATLNTAEHFGVDREVGILAPGRFADFALVPDLAGFSPWRVYLRGRLAAEEGRLVLDLPGYRYPDWARASVRLARPLAPGDFRLSAPGDGVYQAHVIGVLEGQAPTEHRVLEVRAEHGAVAADPGRDLAKAAVVERHRGSGRVQVGLVQGFGLAPGTAMASTVAHDAHQMVVVGTDDAAMALAANALAEAGGGQVAVRDGKVLALLPLPIAGLISDRPVDEVAAAAERLLAAIARLGSPMKNANMQLALLPLAVIPALRLTDRGLVDVERFRIIPVLEG